MRAERCWAKLYSSGRRYCIQLYKDTFFVCLVFENYKCVLYSSKYLVQEIVDTSRFLVQDIIDTW